MCCLFTKRKLLYSPFSLAAISCRQLELGLAANGMGIQWNLCIMDMLVHRLLSTIWRLFFIGGFWSKTEACLVYSRNLTLPKIPHYTVYIRVIYMHYAYMHDIDSGMETANCGIQLDIYTTLGPFAYPVCLSMLCTVM